MLRTLAGLVALAAISLVSAAAKPHPAAKAHAVVGFSDTAETVMGTLTAPPNRRFLARIRNGKMGGVVLLGNGWLTRHTAATGAAGRGRPHPPSGGQGDGRAPEGGWSTRRAAPDRRRPGRRDGQAARLGAAD